LQESLPSEYAKIFAFDNFARTQKSVLKKAKENDSGIPEGCVNLGCFVRLHVLHVPAASAEQLLSSYKKIPVVTCGLLQHETKMSVLHFRYSCFHTFKRVLSPFICFHVLATVVGFVGYGFFALSSVDCDPSA
jgi:pre-rRNA-processing protein TSR1